MAAACALLLSTTVAGNAAQAKKNPKESCTVTVENDSELFAAFTSEAAMVLCRYTMNKGPKVRFEPISDGSEGIPFRDIDGGDALSENSLPRESFDAPHVRQHDPSVTTKQLKFMYSIDSMLEPK